MEKTKFLEFVRRTCRLSQEDLFTEVVDLFMTVEELKKEVSRLQENAIYAEQQNNSNLYPMENESLTIEVECDEAGLLTEPLLSESIIKLVNANYHDRHCIAVFHPPIKELGLYEFVGIDSVSNCMTKHFRFKLWVVPSDKEEYI